MLTKGLKLAHIFSYIHLIIRLKSLINCSPCRFMDISDFEDWPLYSLFWLFFHFHYLGVWLQICDKTFSWQGYKSCVLNIFMGLPNTTQSVSYFKMELEVCVSWYSTETNQVLLFNYLQRRSNLTRQTRLLLTSVSSKATEETATNYIFGPNFKRWEQQNPRGLIFTFFFPFWFLWNHITDLSVASKKIHYYL